MKYTTLGNTDIKVSCICVGGMSFGKVSEGGHQWLLDQNACTEMIGHALDLGVNFIDTANTYGNEQEVGLACRKFGIVRSELFITTKLWACHGYQDTLRSIDSSLKKIGMDYIDACVILGTS